MSRKKKTLNTHIPPVPLGSLAHHVELWKNLPPEAKERLARTVAAKNAAKTAKKTAKLAKKALRNTPDSGLNPNTEQTASNTKPQQGKKAAKRKAAKKKAPKRAAVQPPKPVQTESNKAVLHAEQAVLRNVNYGSSTMSANQGMGHIPVGYLPWRFCHLGNHSSRRSAITSLNYTHSARTTDTTASD